MAIISCPRLKNATALAHKRGLLEKKQTLTCELEGECNQVDCFKSEDPNFRSIFIKESDVRELSQKDKFYMKLEKCLRVRRERG